jgi:hypothetical protein
MPTVPSNISTARSKTSSTNLRSIAKPNNNWGDNARLNQLCGITSPVQYSLAFNLESLIAPDRILHVQQHYTPPYTVPAFETLVSGIQV